MLQAQIQQLHVSGMIRKTPILRSCARFSRRGGYPQTPSNCLIIRVSICFSELCLSLADSLGIVGQELLLISGKQTLPDHSEKEVIEPAEKTQEEVKDREKKEDDDKVIYDEVFGQLKAFREQKDTLEIRALEGQWA